SELLWALKGGGGNFGVVTSLEFQAHPISPEVWTTVVMYPASMGVDVLRYFRDFMATASRDYMGLAVFWNSPSEHEIPEPARNRPVVVLVVCYTGPVEDGEEAVRPLRRIG